MYEEIDGVKIEMKVWYFTIEESLLGGAFSFFLREELDVSPDRDMLDFCALNSGLFLEEPAFLFNDNPATAEGWIIEVECSKSFCFDTLGGSIRKPVPASSMI